MSKLVYGTSRHIARGVQDLEKVVSLLVSLSEQAQREGGDGVMAPRPEKGHKKHLALLVKCK